MKNFILICMNLIINATTINAQWEILNEGFKGGINTIDFVNENIGWIAGWNGTLLNTTDGGENWNTININESWNLDKIDFINELVGWAVGSEYTDSNSYAIIITTTDGGNNWLIQKQIDNSYLSAIYAIDENNVYATGNDQIYKTTNGGMEWNNISPNLDNRDYYSIWFCNPDTGVVVGYTEYPSEGVIMKTTNAGISWDEKVVNEFNSIADLQFLDNTKGYFSAWSSTNSFLCKTEDMCDSYTIISSNSFHSYQFLNSDVVYAVTSDNSITKSTDGGITWTNIQSFKWFLSQIYFSSSKTGFLINPNIISQSIDSGYTWITKKISFPFNNIYFINEQKGFANITLRGRAHSLNYSILLTTNGGISWNIGDILWGLLNSITFLDDSVGFYLTNGGNADIYKSSNGGNDWFPVYNDNFTGNDISFLNGEMGWAVGYCDTSDTTIPAILITTDSGSNWDLEWKHSETTEDWGPMLNSICNSGTTGWTVGTNGMIVKYTPESGWKKQTSITDLPLNKVFFYNESNGWITGGYQTEDEFHPILLKTTDNTGTWETNINLDYLINDIWFMNNQHGWAVGCNKSLKGVILESEDGGDNWNVVIDSLIGPLNSIYVKDNYAWAVGEYGLVIRTTDLGVTWIDDENNKIYSEAFKLEQNYPNPFNPSTKISYSIPTNQQNIKVKLIIYDILGREVVRLVNEEKHPGNYEVEWNTASGIRNLASGIYFYRLTAGKYISTKKMVLLK